MSRAGYILIVVALIVGWSANWFWGSVGIAIVAIPFALAIIAGVILLAASAGMRMERGDLLLRPWEAAKRALPIFVVVLALRSLAWVIFPSVQRDWTEALLSAAIFSIVISLYSTAYRKPA